MSAVIVRRLSFEELAPFVLWMAQLPLAEVTKSTYVTGRKEMWLRLGSNLQSIPAGRHRIFRAPEPPPFVCELGDRLLPGWNSLLVCGGQTSIERHSDHGCFEPQAVMLNVGEALFTSYGAGSTTTEVRLGEGDLVLLNIKVPHSSVQLSPARYHMTFRRIKSCYVATAT